MPTFIAIFTRFMLSVWTSKKLRSQQRRPPFQLEKQPLMAPAKRKAPAGTISNSTVHGHVLDGSSPQHEEANPRIEDITNEAVLHGDPIDDTENTEAHQTQSAELTEGHHRSTSHLTRPRHFQSLCSELHGCSATSPHSSPSIMLQLIQPSFSWPTK